ncbi:phosphatase PAP2 family protein [Mycolicibacterium rhodesiae]|uniref:phosphatase PAP2 family protein n=1 Tax=Mycolicibacterium rhodesiae TaxID=36814 RepID=UPI0002E6A128|nr:phosphatase PAP2 family protein [Mycolicibacterium rhodesiae]
MKHSQHLLREAAGTFLAVHAGSEIAVGGLLVSTVAVAAGWGLRNRMPGWAAASLRVAGLVSAIVVLACQARGAGWLTGVDRSVTMWLADHRNPTVDALALTVTNGFGPIVTTGLTAAFGLLVGMRSRSILNGLVIVCTVGGASLLCWLIKLVVERPRPPLLIQVTPETDFSFPSGHVTGAAALFGILAVIVGMVGSRLATLVIGAVGVLTVSAVALSRLYLGVHWLTDVLASVLLAAVVLMFAAALLPTMRVLPSALSPANNAAEKPY